MLRLFEQPDMALAVPPRQEEEPDRAVPAQEAGPGVSATGGEGAYQSDQILRFRKSERILHWSIAVPFMVCFATGMILMFFYNLHSPGISRHIFSWLHRIAGAALFLLPVIAAVRHWRDYGIHSYNVKHAWGWAKADVKWLLLMIPAAVNRKIKLPEQGKFNAAEKINFLMVLCSYPLFVATGLLIWMPERVVLFWIVHVGLALVATPLMLGHIYMALINPDTRVGLSGMLSGYVDRRWAMHHYRLWYRENFGAESEDAGETTDASRSSRKKAIVILRFVTPAPRVTGNPVAVSLGCDSDSAAINPATVKGRPQISRA